MVCSQERDVVRSQERDLVCSQGDMVCSKENMVRKETQGEARIHSLPKLWPTKSAASDVTKSAASDVTDRGGGL
jgi:hypothetical protein